MLLGSIILATILGGVLSMLVAGLIIAGLPQRWLPRLVGFATGVLLAVALLDVLPEAIESQVEAHRIFVTLLIGVLVFFGLERIALWRHSHPDEDHADTGLHAHHHHHIGKDTVLSVMVGDSFHNFVDGVMLAAAFLVSPALGWTTALGVIAHEIPQEAGDFAVLRSAGMSTKRALLFNGVSSLTSIAGGILGYFALSHVEEALPYCLTIAAASFLYIAISDLLPLLRRESHFGTSISQISAMLLGIALIAITGLGHTH
ncbi:MAG: zinc/iron permease [Proteobacteria bacterium]|nr:zinc/iron permease [Pseudomonadota bacterium]